MGSVCCINSKPNQIINIQITEKQKSISQKIQKPEELDETKNINPINIINNEISDLSVI